MGSKRWALDLLVENVFRHYNVWTAPQGKAIPEFSEMQLIGEDSQVIVILGLLYYHNMYLTMLLSKSKERIEDNKSGLYRHTDRPYKTIKVFNLIVLKSLYKDTYKMHCTVKWPHRL